MIVFMYINFRFEPKVSDVCHNLMIKVIDFNDEIVILPVRANRYRINFWNKNKDEAINWTKNGNLTEKRG